MPRLPHGVLVVVEEMREAPRGLCEKRLGMFGVDGLRWLLGHLLSVYMRVRGRLAAERGEHTTQINNAAVVFACRLPLRFPNVQMMHECVLSAGNSDLAQ